VQVSIDRHGVHGARVAGRDGAGDGVGRLGRRRSAPARGRGATRRAPARERRSAAVHRRSSAAGAPAAAADGDASSAAARGAGDRARAAAELTIMLRPDEHGAFAATLAPGDYRVSIGGGPTMTLALGAGEELLGLELREDEIEAAHEEERGAAQTEEREATSEIDE
jgi:hypothetical protein